MAPGAANKTSNNEDGWQVIDPTADFDVPEVPSWIDVSPRTMAIYEHLTSLPQAQLYGGGTYFELWMALPVIERYLARPGIETYKGLVAALGTALRLTEDDLAKAKIRMVEAEVVEATELSPEEKAAQEKVVQLNDRRNRLSAKRAVGE